MKKHKELLGLIQKAKDEIKKSETIKKMCNDHDTDVSIIDYVPVAFKNLDVSARTQNGCIYFNTVLINDFLEKHLHYFTHELVHFFQQCFGDGPTTGSSKDSYLNNEFEQEGFQAQTEYLSETRSDEAAEKYVEKVLDHHDVPKKERKERREDLLNLAMELYLKKKKPDCLKYQNHGLIEQYN